MDRSIGADSELQTAHAYWSMDREDSARAFRAARRHSRLVRFLRIALPAMVAVVAVVVFLVTYFNPLRMLSKLPINISDLVVSGSKITMQQPHLSGFTSDSRAYEVSASDASQDLTKPNLVELHDIRAKVEMQDKSVLHMTAIEGVYNSKAETLKLDKDIELTSSTGYAGRLSEATIDIRQGHVVSDHPVHVKLLQGTLDANRLEIINSGEVVRFDGGVNMTMTLHQVDAASAKDGAPGQVKSTAQ